MKVGIVTRSYGGMTNEETAKLMAQQGYKCTELCFVQSDSNYWLYNGRGDIDKLNGERLSMIVRRYYMERISVEALGCFANCMAEDDDEFKLNIEYFEKYLQLASVVGIKNVSTECGFVPDRRGVQAHIYEKAYNRLVEFMTIMSEKCFKYGVNICIEPCVLDVIPSAKRMRDFIVQIGSKYLKVLLDPANLIANSSEEDMFRYLAPYIGYFHGKDRKINDAYGRLLGDGDIDWAKFFALYHKYTEGVPFIVEYPNKDTAPEVYERIQKFDELSKNIVFM